MQHLVVINGMQQKGMTYIRTYTFIKLQKS